MPTTFTFTVTAPTNPPVLSPHGNYGTIHRRGLSGLTTEPATSLLEVPTATQWDSYEQRTILDGVEYALRFQWNERSNAWFFSLFYTDGRALIRNKKLTTNTDLLYALVDPLRPPGSLQLLCVEPENYNEPQRDDLGTKFVLCYAGYNDA